MNWFSRQPQFLRDMWPLIRRILLPATIALMLAIFMAACAGGALTTREKGTLTGAALGAGTGAILGGGKGAAIGGALGGLGGAVVGGGLQEQEYGQYSQQRRLEEQQLELERQRRELEELRLRQDYYGHRDYYGDY